MLSRVENRWVRAFALFLTCLVCCTFANDGGAFRPINGGSGAVSSWDPCPGGSSSPVTVTATRATMTDVSRQSVNVTSPFTAGIFPSLSRFVFKTTASSVTINWGDNLPLSAATSQLTVETSVDGATWTILTAVTPVPNGTASSYTSMVALPGGIQYVEIVNGPTAEGTPFGQDYWDGTEVTSVTFPNCAVNVPDTPTVARRFVVGTSSIEAGFYGTPASQTGICALFRSGFTSSSVFHRYPGPVVCDAFSGGMIFHDFGGPFVTGSPTLTFSASAHTITRSSGSFITDGFVNSDPIWVSGTISNNISQVAVSTVSATILSFPSGLTNEGPVSGAALWGPNAPQNYVNQLAGIGTVTDLMLEPTNDWPTGNPTVGAGSWCAATMATNLPLATDVFHAAYPGAHVWLMGSITRANETNTNACGDTLDTYRTALSTAASARPSYMTFFNGKTFVPVNGTNYTPDNVHLLPPGQALMGAGIAGAMSFSIAGGTHGANGFIGLVIIFLGGIAIRRQRDEETLERAA